MGKTNYKKIGKSLMLAAIRGVKQITHIELNGQIKAKSVHEVIEGCGSAIISQKVTVPQATFLYFLFTGLAGRLEQTLAASGVQIKREEPPKKEESRIILPGR